MKPIARQAFFSYVIFERQVRSSRQGGAGKIVDTRIALDSFYWRGLVRDTVIVFATRKGKELLLITQTDSVTMPKKGSPSYNATFLQRLKNQDAKAQLLVWKQERKTLNYLAHSILRSQTEAETILADVFCDFFYRYVDSVEKPSAIRAYLRIMVVRRSRRLLQLTKRHIAIEEEENFPVNKEPMDTESKTDTKLWSIWLDHCLGKLKPRSRKVLKLYYSHDLNLAEIGAKLGNSRQGIHRIVKNCHKTLHRCIEKQRKDKALARKYNVV